jgi:hypothetical protein
MTTTNLALRPVRAHATGPAPQAVTALVGDLIRGLRGRPAAAVLYFASSRYDPTDLAGPIAAQFPGTAVIGCSTAGEFTDERTGSEGISAIAFPVGILDRARAALGELSTDVVVGTQQAVEQLETALGSRLRALDPTRHVGFVLIDGLTGCEEQVNETLGNIAPLLEFVGGSAGDDLAFERTWVAAGDRISYQGVALLVAESAAPFHIIKTCSFRPTGKVLTITRTDPTGRLVFEIDGRPAAEAYAEAVGVDVDRLDSTVWMRHPLGLMIGGEPWIRSPQCVEAGGSIRFYAQLRPGLHVQLMSAGNLVTDTRDALAQGRTALGGVVRGAVLFNCVLRRLEMDAGGTGELFVAGLQGIPVAGFHTYGETWLGHVNQTLTGVLFG